MQIDKIQEITDFYVNLYDKKQISKSQFDHLLKSLYSFVDPDSVLTVKAYADKMGMTTAGVRWQAEKGLGVKMITLGGDANNKGIQLIVIK